MADPRAREIIDPADIVVLPAGSMEPAPPVQLLLPSGGFAEIDMDVLMDMSDEQLELFVENADDEQQFGEDT